jgi:hypothetical protein
MTQNITLLFKETQLTSVLEMDDQNEQYPSAVIEALWIQIVLPGTVHLLSRLM